MKDYLEMWVAVGGLVVIVFGGIYYPVFHLWPMWAMILVVIVLVHIGVGWMWLVRKWFG